MTRRPLCNQLGGRAGGLGIDLDPSPPTPNQRPLLVNQSPKLRRINRLAADSDFPVKAQQRIKPDPARGDGIEVHPVRRPEVHHHFQPVVTRVGPAGQFDAEIRLLQRLGPVADQPERLRARQRHPRRPATAWPLQHQPLQRREEIRRPFHLRQQTLTQTNGVATRVPNASGRLFPNLLGR